MEMNWKRLRYLSTHRVLEAVRASIVRGRASRAVAEGKERAEFSLRDAHKQLSLIQVQVGLLIDLSLEPLLTLFLCSSPNLTNSEANVPPSGMGMRCKVVQVLLLLGLA